MSQNNQNISRLVIPNYDKEARFLKDKNEVIQYIALDRVRPLIDQPDSEETVNQKVKEMVYLMPKKEENPKTNGKVNNFSANEGHTSLSKGETVRLGDIKINITDPYGVRNFKGREGEHSRGIDVTTSTGKAHALSDGVIEEVVLQGSGNVISPTQGKEAGYYVVIRNNDGTKTQYMHLDPMTETDMKNLKGRKLKRGDEIWGYKKGSGSMTGPHVKIRHYGEDPSFNIDPSQLIKGEQYTFVPNAKGENILRMKNGGILKYN